MIMISGSLMPKILMELIFNPCHEFLLSTVSQTHSPHFLFGAHGISSDLLRSVKILKREWGAESNGKIPHLLYSISVNTAALVRETAVKDLPLAELQPKFLRLQ